MRKRTIEVVVVSDLYLGSEKCKAHELLTYLSSIKPKTLILNGGLVAGAGSGLYELPKTQLKVIKKIVAMASQGTEVYVLADEKDHYLKKLSGIAIGTIKIGKELILELDHKKTWFLHGQNFNLEGKSALFLKPFGRYSYTMLIQWNRMKIALKRLFKTQKTGDVNTQIPQPSLTEFRNYAIRCTDAKGLDAVACGYTGHADKQLIKGETDDILYLNSGDWTKSMTALEYAFKRWKIYKYQADKCSAFYTDEELKSLDMHDVKALITSPGKPKQGKGPKKLFHKRVS